MTEGPAQPLPLHPESVEAAPRGGSTVRVDASAPTAAPGDARGDARGGAPGDDASTEPIDERLHGRRRHTARQVAFHVGVIAAFAIPALVLWWRVWIGHPASTLTCSCGDPAQQVWFTAWPAWAMAHLHDPFFSGAVNVPWGANLLSNTSGPLVGIALAPVTWAFGPVAATNVGLVMAPALSAWGCFLAVRALVTWWPGAVVAALVYGYSAAIVTSLIFGHLSVTVMVLPPLLFTLLHEIVVRQERPWRRDGAWLAGLLVLQFLISPEVLVLCGLLALIGLVATAVVGWRHVAARLAHAARALGLGLGVACVLLAFPTWFALAGPQSVTGVLFVLAPFAGLPFSGVLAPGRSGAAANAYVRFGGYLGHNGPPPDYLGAGALVGAAASAVLARRRPLTWLLVFMSVVTLLLGLGSHLVNGPSALHQVWLPWRGLANVTLLKEIIPGHFAPFLPFFVGALLAVGLDALWTRLHPPDSPANVHARFATWTATGVMAALALAPVMATFDIPLNVQSVVMPSYLRHEARSLAPGTVVLTVPFAVTGSDQPMLWQAVDDFRFRLAGAALKTPNKSGGPVALGAPGSARRILTSLTVGGLPEPDDTPDDVAAIRDALGTWHVERVLVAGAGRDPVYATGFLTAVLGSGPSYIDGAWLWQLPRGEASLPVHGVALSRCRTAVARLPSPQDPLAMARCVLFAAGRTWTTEP